MTTTAADPSLLLAPTTPVRTQAKAASCTCHWAPDRMEGWIVMTLNDPACRLHGKGRYADASRDQILTTDGAVFGWRCQACYAGAVPALPNDEARATAQRHVCLPGNRETVAAYQKLVFDNPIPDVVALRLGPVGVLREHLNWHRLAAEFWAAAATPAAADALDSYAGFADHHSQAVERHERGIAILLAEGFED